MKYLLSVLLFFSILKVSATTFPAPIVGGKPTLTSMTGHNPGDTMTIATGSYAGYNFSNLRYITILPASGTTSVLFTSEGGFASNIGVVLKYLTFTNTLGAAMNCDATSNRHCKFLYCRFIDVASVCIHADGTFPWTSGDSTTLAFYDLVMDSITEIRCPALMRVGFGGLNQNHPNPSNICDSVTITRFVSLASTGTAEEGTEVRFAGCFRPYFAYWNIFSITQRGPSGDVGCAYFKGGSDGTFHDIYRWGGPGYVLRLYGNTQTAFPRTTVAYNIGQFNSTCYGLVDFRYDATNDIPTVVQSCGFDFWNMTKGNALDQASGYGANLAVIGNIDSTKSHRIRNLLGFNIQKAGNSYLIKDQSNGTYNFKDTANTQYYASATLAKLDSTTAYAVNYLGSFPLFAPTSASPGNILHGGATNPYTAVDILGNPMRVPPDLGYVQFANGPVTLSFTPLVGDYVASNRGAEYWGTTVWDDVYAPTVPAGNTTPGTQYIRLNWKDIENNGTQGVDGPQGEYHFDLVLDPAINHAIGLGATFKIALMPMCTACTGGFGNYPTYVHNLMQADGGNNTDWFYATGGFWVPNWNNVHWKQRYNALLKAVADHIAATSFSGKTYTSAFIGFDRRDYGDFGEGHDFPWNASIPTGRQITDSTLMQGVDSMISIYPNVLLSQPMNYVAPNNNYSNASGNPGPQAAWYALTRRNNMGPIGVRRDNLGDDGYNGWLTGTTTTYNPGTGPVSLYSLIMNQWKYAPFTGEPARDDAGVSRCGILYCDLHNEDSIFHISSMANGNYQTNTSGHAGEVANLRNAWAEQGYRLVLPSGRMTANILSGNAFNITLQWQNIGLAPVYENWKVMYELRNSGGTVVWTGISRFTPRLLLPSATPTTVSDMFSMNNAIPPSTYTMYVIVRDPAGYKAPLQLAITGRQPDGSYILRSGITMLNSPSTDSLTVVKIWGESNAAGNAPNTGAPASELGTRSEVKIWNHATHVYENLNIGVNNQQDDFGIAGRHGLELSMANEVDSGHLPNPTYLIKNGVSGSFIGQWMPGAEGNFFRPGAPPGGGSLWDGWELTYGVAGVTAINALAKPYRFYEWQSIGLNDEFGQITPIDSFVNRMARFRARSRALYSNQNIIFLGTNFNNPPLSTLPSNWENVYRLTIPQQDARYHEAPVLGATYMDGGSHFDYQGFKLIGKNMVDTMLSLQGAIPPVIPVGVTAYAGPNQTITLPTSSVVLDGTGSTGIITSYLWSKLSGPSTMTIVSPTSAITSVTGLLAGVYVLQLSVNGGISLSQVTITVNAAVGAGSHIFTTQIPVATTGNDNQPTVGMEVGVRFRSATSGYITGIRFYKTAGLIGTHIGELYTNTGTRLAQATFSGETATGWQSVTFATPVAITAGVTYMAAYFSSLGYYVEDNDYFLNTGLTNSPLTALQDGVAGCNGPYLYSATQAFPTACFRSANYWVDVNFIQNLPPIARITGSNIITLPTTNVVLDGSASSDPDGNIVSYAWSKISGPNTPIIVSATSSSTNITGLLQGTYVFQLLVTDNMGFTGTSTQTVAVNASTPGVIHHKKGSKIYFY